jgi:hypothetical protein
VVLSSGVFFSVDIEYKIEGSLGVLAAVLGNVMKNTRGVSVYHKRGIDKGRRCKLQRFAGHYGGESGNTIRA